MKVPNILSLSRMVLAPVFIFFFIQKTGWGAAGALLVAIAFEVTDLLDGEIARRTGQVSSLGKFLDPLADSISRFTVFLCFLAAGYASVWVVAIIFWRDSMVASLRVMAATKGVIVSARVTGKIKAWFQGTAIISTLCFEAHNRFFGEPLFGTDLMELPALSRLFMVIVAAWTFLSLCDYLWGNRKLIASLDR